MDVEGIKLTITIISAIIALLSFLGFGTVFAMMWKDRHDRKVAEKEETSQLREEKKLAILKQVMKDVIANELTPVKKQLTTLSEDVGTLKIGVQATCWNDLEDIYALAEKNHYCSSEDKHRFEQTYLAYHSLGKNGVMDAKREKLLKMDETKPSKKSKTVLVEDK